MSGMVERVAREHYLGHARTALEALRSFKPVIRQNGDMVHQLVGAPEDIWITLLDAAVGDGDE